MFIDPNVICAFSRKPANMSLSYGDTRSATENRKDFFSQLGINYQDLVCARQVHGDGIAVVEESDKGRGALEQGSAFADTDALITATRQLPLAVFTADCLSLFLRDQATLSIGLVHAGWQGTRQGIAAKTVQRMQEEFHTRPQDLLVGFGPCIRQCCYEVGNEFREYFQDGLAEKNGRFYLDLAGVNRQQLLECGVLAANISDAQLCTSCHNDEFFSCRREGSSCGRMISVMMIR
jgi:YfiH family protein